MKKKFRKNGHLLVLVIGILAFCMMFVPQLVYQFKTTGLPISISGDKEYLQFMDVIFGKTETSGSISVEVYKFNYLILISYCLPLVAGVIALLFKNKLGYLISTIVFVAAAVMLALTKTFFININELSNFESYYSLFLGPIFGLAISAIGALVSVYGILARNS